MPDKSYHRAIEAELLSILGGLGPDWTQADVAAVRAEIEYGEYGLALDALAGTVVSLGRPMATGTRQRVAALAARMGVGETELVRKLCGRAAASSTSF